jgi:hypothetical protein
VDALPHSRLQTVYSGVPRRLSGEQRVWMDALDECDTIASGIIRPAQLGLLVDRLTQPAGQRASEVTPQ